MGRQNRYCLLVLLLWTYQIHAWSWFSSTNEQQLDGNEWSSTISVKGAEFSLQTQNVNPEGVLLIDHAKSMMASANSCWQNAYRDLFAGCSEMIADKEKQSRLAWHLSDCFQRDSGRNPFPYCGKRSPMVKCLASLDEFAHKIYLEFFLESNSICHQLQSEAFKHETERLVNELQQSAQFAEEKLNNIEAATGLLLQSSSQVQDSLAAINSQTQEVVQMSKQVEIQIDDALIHSKAIFEKSKEIASSQLQLQEGQLEMRAKMESGMAALQDSYENLGEGMEKLKEEALVIEKEIFSIGDSMSLKMQKLQSRADDIGTIAGSSLEKQKQLLEGQSEALEGLNFLKKFQTQALEESRATIHDLIEYGHKQQDKLLEQQKQLQNAHDHLIQNSKSILAAQEAFESKQASMFTTLDKLFTLLNSIVLESRFIKTSIYYIGAVIFAYWLTSARQISRVRAHFYLGICLTFVVEFMAIRLGSLNVEPSWLESNIFWMRSMFLLLVALGLSIYSIFCYRDYEQLNNQMLSSLRDKVEALERSMTTVYLTLESDSNLSSWADTEMLEDEDVCNDPDYAIPEVVAENSVTTSTSTRKYDLRSRLRN